MFAKHFLPKRSTNVKQFYYPNIFFLIDFIYGFQKALLLVEVSKIVKLLMHLKFVNNLK